MKGFRRAHSTVFRLLLAASIGIFAAVLPAQKVDQLPKPTDYVSDLAHVLSPETVASLDHLCAQLDHSQANAQIAIVTVQTLDGDDAADYSNQLEDKWKIGKKGSDRGVLILLAVGDHKRRIEVGYGLEGILPDAKLGDIGREMVPDLRANDFDGAVTLAVGEIAQVIAADAKVTLDQDPNQDPAMSAQSMRRHQRPPSAGKVLLIIILVLFFGGFFVLRLLMSFGMMLGGWGRGPWIGGGGGWGGGGGGWGGGGSGGGGGFGGFGGGSFGGGGAGGSW